MKFMVLLSVVCLGSSALAAPANKSKRDILPGDPRYGTDYHHHHHHHHQQQEQQENEVQVTKAVGGYAGSYSAPSSGYGPPGHTPGAPVPTIQHSQPQIQRTSQELQQNHHQQHIQQPSSGYLEPTIKSKQTIPPSTSYGVPAQHLDRQQPTIMYLAPVTQEQKQSSAPINSYGSPIENYETSVSHEHHHDAPTAQGQHDEHQQTPAINLQSYQNPAVHSEKSVISASIHPYSQVQTYQEPINHNIEINHGFHKNIEETPSPTFESSLPVLDFSSIPSFNSFGSQFETIPTFGIPNFSNFQSAEFPRIFHEYQPSSSGAFQHPQVQVQSPQFESQSVVVDSVQHHIPTVYKQPMQQAIGSNGGYVY